MDFLLDFKALSIDLAKHVDVLIQHSENYYAVSEAVATPLNRNGNKARFLTRQAIGHEIVSRLYRLIKNDPDACNYLSLINRLDNDELLREMMSSFNHDGRKTLDELISLRDDVTTLFHEVSDSIQFEKLLVYRARFVAHRAKRPRVLDRARDEADVIELSSTELRWQTDMLSVIADKVSYMINRSGFPADDIAYMARDEAYALWGLQPPRQRRSFRDVLDVR